MRPVTHQAPASLQLLKTLLQALTPRGEGEQPAGGQAEASLQPRTGAPPPPSPPTLPARTHAGPPPPSVRSAPVAPQAVAAQMLATLMAESDAAHGAPAKPGLDEETRSSPETTLGRLDEPAPPPPALATGTPPWAHQALAAYGARHPEAAELQPGRRVSLSTLGGGSDRGGVTPNPPTVLRRALVWTCAVVVVLFLLKEAV